MCSRSEEPWRESAWGGGSQVCHQQGGGQEGRWGGRQGFRGSEGTSEPRVPLGGGRAPTGMSLPFPSSKRTHPVWTFLTLMAVKVSV